LARAGGGGGGGGGDDFSNKLAAATEHAKTNPFCPIPRSSIIPRMDSMV
jgi:hypothetical protein